MAIAELGRTVRPWFGQLLELPKGVPAHDTFGRVFALLAPEVFEACCGAWVASIRDVIPGEIIAIDGTTLRRSECAKRLAAPHLVSACCATENRVVLGQEGVLC